MFKSGRGGGSPPLPPTPGYPSVFKSYITPIFSYDSKLWALTNNMQRQVDSFQRRIIRTFVLNVRWPTIVKNEEIFTEKEIRTVVHN